MTSASSRQEPEADQVQATLTAARQWAEAAETMAMHGRARLREVTAALAASEQRCAEAVQEAANLKVSAAETLLTLDQTQRLLETTRRELAEAIAARSAALATEHAVLSSASWQATAPLRTLVHFARGQVGRGLIEVGVPRQRLERIKRVAASRGSLAIRLSRVTFYLLSRGASRAPGASHVARRISNLEVGRRIVGRNGAYVAMVGDGSAAAGPDVEPDGPQPDTGLDLSAAPGAEEPAAALETDRLYRAWIARQPPEQDISRADGLPGIKITIVMTVDRISAPRLDDTLRSLAGQRHLEWEVVLCALQPLASEGSAADRDLQLAPEWLAEPRIRIAAQVATRVGEALGYAAVQASGDCIMVLEPGDALPHHALSLIASRFKDDPSIDILYADEDVIDNGVRLRPQFKPGWSPDLLTAYNYFGRPTVIRRGFAAASGWFDKDLDHAVEWDLNLRLTRELSCLTSTRRIHRLAAVLCHRHPLSRSDRTAPDTPQAAEARAVLQRHWLRNGLEAEVSTLPEGTQHAIWPILDPPLVSIVIPNRNQHDLLRLCLFGLMHKTAYKKIEIVVVDNGSTDADVLSLYREVEKQGVIVVPFNEPFSYSRACNRGVAASSGELILFLNNDIEVIEKGWLDELVRVTLLPGVGMAGAKLLYPDGGIQHAGVAIGLFTLCAHVFRLADEHEWGIFGSPGITRNWMGVTGACQMIRRTVYNRVGGKDERFTLAYSDIKLSLDVWRAGYRIVYAPAATLIHHEGASRGDLTPRGDQERMAVSLRACGIEEDPYLHPELAALSFIPRLPLEYEVKVNKTSLRINIEGIAASSATPADGDQDIFDDGLVAAKTGMPLQTIFWPARQAEAATDPMMAAAFVIDLLRSRSDLRARFPRALSEGGRGEFCRVVEARGTCEPGLSFRFHGDGRRGFSP